MKRYLLFDSGCTVCTSLAQYVQQETQGWLMARSLHDPEIQQQLNNAQKDWKWEPTIVEVRDDQVQIFTGRALYLKLLVRLGPKKTWRLVKLAQKAEGEAQHSKNKTRRKILKWGGALIGGVAFGLGWDKNMPMYASTTTGRFVTGSIQQTEALSLLQNSPTIQAAAVHFGTVDWKNVHKYEDTQKSETGYIVFFNSPNTSAETTFLTLSELGGNVDRFATVCRTQVTESHNSVLTWFTYDGKRFATTAISNGKTTTSIASTAQPDFNFGCFLACIGAYVTPACAMSCTSCAIEFNVFVKLLKCVQCGICLGPIGRACLAICNF